MDVIFETALSRVKDYGEHSEFIFSQSLQTPCDLERFSYAKWTVEEVLRRLEERRGTPPLEVIEDFRDKMEEYSQHNDIFSIALDVTQDIIDLFC